jgi:hypothetical protein
MSYLAIPKAWALELAIWAISSTFGIDLVRNEMNVELSGQPSAVS